MRTGRTPRSLGFRTDLALLRLAGSTTEVRDGYTVIASPHNPGYWWGNFLLLHDLPAAGSVPDWLDRFAEEFPDADHRTFGVDTTTGRVADLAAFAEAGFRVEASAVLTARSVHGPPFTDPAAEYRALTSDDDWAQSVELRICTDPDEWHLAGHRPFVVAKTATNRRLVESGRARWFGAFLDGRLVSQLGLVHIDEEVARYQSVETDPQYRRRGLAGTLLHRAARWGFDDLGVRTLVIVADPDYVAIDLYRQVGFIRTENELQAELRPTS